MKRLFPFLTLLLMLVFTSCSSIRVVHDYDKDKDFNQVQTYAYFKPGIDEVKLSDIDKKRILRAIDAEMKAKGLNTSDTPDVMISLYTKEEEVIGVYQNYYGGYWGWSPWYYGPGYAHNSVSRSTKGMLFIDIIDAKTNQLVWQGIGKANLDYKSIEKKEAHIKEIVGKILAAYPPAE